MPLRLTNDNLETLRGGLELKTVSPVRDGEWIGHTENYIVRFRYKKGLLFISMAETEYELPSQEQPVAINTDISKMMCPQTAPISITEILDFLEWDCDDYFC